MGTSNRRHRAKLAALVAALLVAGGAAPAAASATASGQHWSATWGAAVQRPFEMDWTGPNWSTAGFTNHSVRQVVRISAGGSQLRIRLSNAYGTRPLRLAGATVARSAGGAVVQPHTLRPVRFGRAMSTTIPAGGTAVSDPIILPVAPLTAVTVTLYFAEPTGAATFHETALTTGYRATGDHRFDVGGGAFTGETSHSSYYLAGVDVTGRPATPRRTVVAFGDSITEGFGTTPDTDRRYPDRLAARLAASGRPISVVNAGIGGNWLITDSTCFGEAAVHRFERDVLRQPGVRTAIVLIGINDIVAGGGDDFGCGQAPRVDASQLIEGHRTLIRAAHAHHVQVIGATLTQFKGNQYFYTPERENLRDQLNQWIRASGEYDAVVDLDQALADPEDRDALNPAYASIDRVHPNDAGADAIAQAIDLATL